MNEQLFAPFLTNCCNICTQKHGPLSHNDMIVLREPYKESILQDDIVGGIDVNIQAFFPKVKISINKSTLKIQT